MKPIKELPSIYPVIKNFGCVITEIPALDYALISPRIDSPTYQLEA